MGQPFNHIMLPVWHRKYISGAKLDVVILFLVLLSPKNSIGQQSEIALPLLSKPVLVRDMSPATKEAYRWLEDLSERWSESNVRDSILNNTSASVARRWVRSINFMQHYDPLLFAQYCQKNTSASSTEPLRLIQIVNSLLDHAARLRVFSPVTTYLSTVNIIRRISVTGIKRDSTTSKVTVTYNTLEHVKGRDLRGISSVNKQVDAAFTYNAGWNKDGGDLNGVFADLKSDRIFGKDALGWNAVEVGKEYLVFLNIVADSVDERQSYFSISPIMDGNGGIYPIVNDQVIDSKNVRGQGERAKLPKFIAELRRRIRTILH